MNWFHEFGKILELSVMTFGFWMLWRLMDSATDACRAITKFLSGPAINITDNRKYTVVDHRGNELFRAEASTEVTR